MIRLLILRAVPVLLRPAVVLLEGALITTDAILVLALPLAMTALIISSIPLHLDYFKAQPTDPAHDRLAREYISGLTWLCLISVLILPPMLIWLPLDLSFVLVAVVCLLFLTEKLADEVSRALEFRKEFVKWFLVQSLRSGWLAIPIALNLMGMTYEAAFLLMSGIACGLMYLLYIQVLGLKPQLGREGFKPIRGNLVFLAGSFFPASYQQLPRIVIAKLFPEEAHIYLAVAQVTQGVNLIFNVRFQIPYRRIIARKSITFQRRLRPAMLRVLLSSGVIALFYLFIPVHLATTNLSNGALAALLVPIMTANALTFSVLGTYLGYIQWFARKIHVLFVYLVSIAIAGLALMTFNTGTTGDISLTEIPALAVVIGFIWIFLIMGCFFSNRAKDV